VRSAQSSASIRHGADGGQARVDLYGRLLGAVRRSLGAQDAEDVVQDAFVRLAAVTDTSPPVRDPNAFLYTVTRNLVRDRGRAAAVRAAVSGEFDEGVLCTEPDAVRVIAGRQQLVLLERALAELPPKRRAALVLRRFDGLSHTAIGEMLGLSVSSVEKHIRAALVHCRRRLAEWDEVA
jgi:RNA polymerase sigma factor (sigma-70 family)